MKAQVLLTPWGAKYLVAKALLKKIDFSKRIYIAYGSLNQIFLDLLGFSYEEKYVAGCFANNKLNVTKNRPEIVILHNKRKIKISEFDLKKDDYFIKGANALWYEKNKKYAAVAAADEKGGTYGNFYIKAACVGANVIIPVTHEKLIPYFVPATQNVDLAMGSKIAMLKFFYGEVFSEIEAFKLLFDVEAKVIAAGGIEGNEGSIVFLLEGENLKEVVEFIEDVNNYRYDKKGEFLL